MFKTMNIHFKSSLSRMWESAAEMINKHIGKLLYDNGVDPDLTSLWVVWSGSMPFGVEPRQIRTFMVYQKEQKD